MHRILLGYEVRYAKNDEIPLTWEIKTVDVHTRKTVLRDLMKFTPYKVVICAKTSKGCGKEYSAIAHTWEDGELDTNGLSYCEVQYSRTLLRGPLLSSQPLFGGQWLKFRENCKLYDVIKTSI